MKYTNSQQFIKGKLSENSSLVNVSSKLERDDEDPLSIRNLSSTFIGFAMAFLVILLPLISVLLGRPLSQKNEIHTNQSIKKDGS